MLTTPDRDNKTGKVSFVVWFFEILVVMMKALSGGGNLSQWLVHLGIDRDLEEQTRSRSDYNLQKSSPSDIFLSSMLNLLKAPQPSTQCPKSQNKCSKHEPVGFILDSNNHVPSSAYLL